jgi:nitrogen-specific signal transduction histidine kinase
MPQICQNCKHFCRIFLNMVRNAKRLDDFLCPPKSLKIRQGMIIHIRKVIKNAVLLKFPHITDTR